MTIRSLVPELEKILGVTFPVLKNGFIRVVDYMGSDESIVQAARVSYGKGTKRAHEDRGLIRYLMRHRHTTPFEMCEIKLHVRVPMDTWRQWIRHRTANVNEYSTRYSEAIDSFDFTLDNEWRKGSSANRQGSGSFMDEVVGRKLSRRERRFQSLALAIYRDRLKKGVTREQARKDLLLSTYTEAYWKIDLHNLLHFLELRLNLNAQLEIRQYATVIGNEILSRWCPIAWEAFRDYRLDSIVLSSVEISIINAFLSGGHTPAVSVAADAGFLEKDEKGLKHVRERYEIEAKMRKLGLPIPWES
jgi:thymidylate synthase (FAD)